MYIIAGRRQWNRERASGCFPGCAGGSARSKRGVACARPRQPGIGAEVGTEVDEEQPAPIVLQGPGVGVKVDVGQTVPVLQLQGQAANVPNLQLTLQWLQQVSAYSQ